MAQGKPKLLLGALCLIYIVTLVARIRAQWHCHKVNAVFGNVLIKASCPTDWLSRNDDNLAAKLTKRRCEFALQTSNNQNELDLQTDPVGMMMPITDLTSGITYANSHCIRCNSKLLLLSQPRAGPTVATNTTTTTAKNSLGKLVYWSPLLECNYNFDTDDRNLLYDLISTYKGQVLQYSIKRKKWTINMSRSGQQNLTREEQQLERTCTVAPMIPESVELSIQANTIQKCKPAPSSQLEQVDFTKSKQECERGNQSLVYGETSGLVYYNLGCAKCNYEPRVSCEQPKTRPPSVKFPTTQTKPIERKPKPEVQNSPMGIFSVPDEEEEEDPVPTEEPVDQLAGFGRSSAGGVIQHQGAPLSGSFSVLMDLYGSSQGDEQVGAMHQCPDAETQVYDPFFLTCRDYVCGINHKLVDGTCVSVAHDKTESPTHASLVEKFKPPMAYLTAIGLLISIASLFVYLILYGLSMFDLRHLVVEMAQAGQKAQMANNPLDKVRGSRESGTDQNSSRATQVGSRSQSLASRGVACLASSLLAAYLLFIMGHQNNQSILETRARTSGETQMKNEKPTVTCYSLAVGTYFCFLVSFNWMFLLSYDVWRTLRLATCQLRGPSLNSQSTRFIIYSLCALFSAALVVSLAIAVDYISANCQTEFDVPTEGFGCNNLVNNYRPKFGQRLNSCWFSNRRALALFFGLPVTLIMSLNLMFFVHSSCMVIQTSSKSSLKLKSSSSIHQANGLKTSDTQNKPKLMGFVAKFNTSGSSESSSASTGSSESTGEQASDYAHQNGLTTSSLASVQTIQSTLSTSSASSSASFDFNNYQPSEGSPPVGERHKAPEGAPEAVPKRPLESSQSSSSLTNQSMGGVSISASLAMKYDAHMQNLSSMMNSIVKDYRLYCRLSTIMGITWLTGLVASIVDNSDVLWYLFVVLNTLQGLFIFIAFGCKRSKLMNVEILINYIQFRWSQMWLASETKKAAAAAAKQQGQNK